MDLKRKLQILSESSFTPNDSPEDKNIEDLEPVLDPASIDDEDAIFEDLSVERVLEAKGYKKGGKKSKKSKASYNSSFFDSIDDDDDAEDEDAVSKLASINRKMAEEMNLAMSEKFDTFLDDDDLFSLEEDTELKDSLVRLGRKYARDTSSSKESSEIKKTFADSEKKMKDLYAELDVDKAAIQKDLDRLRVPQRSSSKMISELVNAKVSLHNAQLAIIKETNSMRAKIYDLKVKEEARKQAENAGSNDIDATTLRNIFSSTRKEIMDGLGGYSSLSTSSGDSSMYIDPDDDEMIHHTYFKGKNEPSEGDKFLEYEDCGVEYILMVDGSGSVQGILAEDRDGNIIDDYPMPSNIDQLTFDIDKKSMTATDSLYRPYKVREV